MERHAFFSPISQLAYLVLSKKIADTTLESDRLDAGRKAGPSSSSSDESASSKPTGDDMSSFCSPGKAALSAEVDVALASLRQPDSSSRDDEEQWQ
jgi:hypothetical protein